MREILILVAAGLGLWAMRASFIIFAAQMPLPEGTEQILNHARSAVLAALVATAMLPYADGGEPSTVIPAMIAALAAAGVARRTRSVARTVAVGMAILWALSLLWL